MVWHGLYALLRWVFRLLLRLLFRWQVYGAHHVPARGGVLVCSNHLSWWDIPVVGCAIPRPVHFMAKQELFRYPVFGWLIRRLGAFPVRRGEPDRDALRTALALLAAGRAVVVYVEGTRSRTGQLLPPQPGAAWLAVKARVPVVPVAIRGPYRLGQPLRVAIGTPYELKEYYERKVNTDDLAEAGRKIMGEIARLLHTLEQEAYRRAG